jgi:hypothetical protein
MMSTPQSASGLQKTQLRQTMRAARNALPGELRQEYSDAIVGRVLRLLESL